MDERWEGGRERRRDRGSGEGGVGRKGRRGDKHDEKQLQLLKLNADVLWPNDEYNEIGIYPTS